MEDSSAFISITAASVSLLSNLCLKDVLYFLTDISVSYGIMTEYMNNLLDEHSYFLKCFWLGICFLLFTQKWKWLFIHPCRSKTLWFSSVENTHTYIYIKKCFMKNEMKLFFLYTMQVEEVQCCLVTNIVQINYVFHRKKESLERHEGE